MTSLNSRNLLVHSAGCLCLAILVVVTACDVLPPEEPVTDRLVTLSRAGRQQRVALAPVMSEVSVTLIPVLKDQSRSRDISGANSTVKLSPVTNDRTVTLTPLREGSSE